MIARPETRYAWNEDVALAYQVFGDGPVDLLYCQGFTSHVDLNWGSRHLARFLEGLGGRARVIHMDRRGWGCSDRFSPGDVAPFEVQVDDMLTVMDAVDSQRAVVFGSWETGIAAMLLASTFPERTAGLVLVDPFVTYVATDETPWMYTEEGWAQINDAVKLTWGRPNLAGDSYRDGVEYRDWYLPWCRASVSPGSLVAETGTFLRTDARSVLPTIHVPTLVVGYADDDLIARNARFTAERISHARLIEPPAADGEGWLHWYGRAPAILEAVGELIEQVRFEQAVLDRVLATVLFTDIVDSTATAATMGDTRWRDLIEEHDRVAKALISRFRGTYVRGTGDGLLATFDGPVRGVRCAEAIVEAMQPLGIEIRAGLHTGEVEYGGHDLAGVGVHIGARVGALAGTNEVWVSSTVKDLVVGSGLTFEDAGEHELKGVPDTWHLYRVVG